MDPQSALQQAIRLHQAGKYAEAERLYRSVLQQQPFNALALHQLGLLARDAGHLVPALELIRQSISLDPGNTGFRINQISLLDRMGQHQAAEDAARKLVADRPADLKLKLDFVGLLRRYRKFDQAISILGSLAQQSPQDPSILFQTAITFEESGDLDRAIERYEQALAVKPDLGQALARLGAIALRRGDRDRALNYLERAERVLSGSAEVLSNLAMAYMFKNRLQEALHKAKAARDLAPADPVVVSTYANVLLTSGAVPEAIEAYERCVDLAANPLEYYSDLLMTRLNVEEPGEAELGHHRRFQQLCTKRIQPRPALPRLHTPGDRLRIGYVSADFLIHPVGLFIEPLIAHHDRTRFEIHCFSNTTRQDELTDRIRASADAFHDLGVNTPLDSVDALIREKQIDILIDLAGHTGGNVLALFARKPAPMQVTYLGYPNTTGLEAIDYRITDAVADPPGLADTYCSEKLIRLPGSFALFAAPAGAPGVGPLPCLEKGHITFGTLARIEKWTADRLLSWSRILRAVPGARFRLIGPGYEDPAFRELLLARLASAGIDPERIETVGHKPFAEYLAELSRFDLLLDSSPFNCHTTTLQALYMGVPTVTLAGVLHRSRMGASVLSALGLPELIADGPEQYEQIAIELSGNTNRLAEMRSTLRQRLLHSSLCDARTFARGFEASLIKAWNQLTGQSLPET